MNGQLDDAVIQAGRLSKAYKGMPVLQGPTLRVPRHSIFGFLGPDGAGKGTTIRLLLGRIRPSGGRASGFDCDIGRDRVAIRRRVGYPAQEPRYTARICYHGPKARMENGRR